MRKYVVHLLRKNLFPLAIFTLFCTLLYVVPVAAENYSVWNTRGSPYSPNLYCGSISAALGVLSVVIPVWLFSYKMDRRSVDLHYALPISRTKILLARFLVGLILLYGSYTVAYIWGVLVTAVKVRRLHLVYFLFLYLASLLPAFLTYSVTAFVYTRANTVWDGIVSVIGAMCVFAAAAQAVSGLCAAYGLFLNSIDGAWFFPFMPLAWETELLGGAIVTGTPKIWFDVATSRYAADVGRVVGGALWVLLSVGATAGLILSEKRSRAETCGQVSSSPFCYKVQLPVYAVLLMVLSLAYSNGPTLPILAVFAILLLSLLYKRTVKVGWIYAAVIVVCLVVGAALFPAADLLFRALHLP